MISLAIAMLAAASLGQVPTPQPLAIQTARRDSVATWIESSGCGSTLRDRRGGTIAFTRATGTGRLTCGGSDAAVAAHVPRIADDGWWIESGAQNMFVNACSAPATQTIATGTGAWSAWVEGSGSLTIEAGTATASGLPCVASSSSPCSWTVSGAGTVTATVAGALTFAQAENSVRPTSKICSAGTALMRQVENASIPNPITAARSATWTVETIVAPAPMSSWGAYIGPARGTAWAFGGNVATNAASTSMQRSPLDPATAIAVFVVYSGSGAYSVLEVAIPNDSAQHRLVASNSAGSLAIQLDGVEVAPYSYGTGGNGTWSVAPASLNIGGIGSPSYVLNGKLSRLKVCRRARDPLCGWAPPGDATKVLAIGDSITAGWYGMALNGLLGTSHRVINAGVSGDTTIQMLARWTGGLRAGGESWLVLLGGTNDLAQSYSAASIAANLSTMISDARADGRRVVISTVLPRSNSSGWTGAMQTQLLALNTTIRGWSDPPGVSVVDGYALLGDGTDPTIMLAAYDSGDHLHPSGTGKRVLAAAVKAVIAP